MYSDTQGGGNANGTLMADRLCVHLPPPIQLPELCRALLMRCPVALMHVRGGRPLGMDPPVGAVMGLAGKVYAQRFRAGFGI